MADHGQCAAFASLAGKLLLSVVASLASNVAYQAATNIPFRDFKFAHIANTRDACKFDRESLIGSGRSAKQPLKDMVPPDGLEPPTP